MGPDAKWSREVCMSELITPIRPPSPEENGADGHQNIDTLLVARDCQQWTGESWYRAWSITDEDMWRCSLALPIIRLHMYFGANIGRSCVSYAARFFYGWAGLCVCRRFLLWGFPSVSLLGRLFVHLFLCLSFHSFFQAGLQRVCVCVCVCVCVFVFGPPFVPLFSRVLFETP